ncbi:pyruvate carboxylase [Salinicoccus hispanicus]|uniref:Pyruvate carboxylase n=1 Tax=Salinicoccus hispanicus TaxID=157225 RepID=A0A6N8TWI9_9STAP|nr:pyruvate carboxylase [Salinicoccus hispanicus]MXQ49772.1 pyruvate carboxylase [Salinicoccus hispanicus]
MNRINKLLVANRGEIAIRIFRACTELDITTVAIYSNEDKGALHRYKADEAYLVGEDLSPTESYLNIEAIIRVAKNAGVDAIHPGYGFLSENMEFARRCQEEGIIFVGPELRHLDMFGDKVKARETAVATGLPVIPGTDGAVQSFEEVEEFIETHGYPIIIKAISGGGGKGMRIVDSADDLRDSYDRAKSEASKSFGNSEVYLEKYVDRPKHIEVQIIGDTEGNMLHLYERDCSVQRRHQKVVEVAPSVGLSDELRLEICEAAKNMGEQVGYVNAGTVEFLVANEEFYFIEVNPRVQVEHTITEMVTGIDIVKTQIQIADGNTLFGEVINLPQQEKIPLMGYAVQCRITTEDPLNDFMPDTGEIMAYRSSGGFGVRLDAGDGFQGAVISPYYDSLLVKLSTHGLTYKDANEKMTRSLKEMRIRGIKTNLQFLINVIGNKDFQKGDYSTKFIDTTPSLFEFEKPKDRGTKTLEYISTITINGFPGVEKRQKPHFDPPVLPDHEPVIKEGTKQILDREGPEGLAKWLKAQEDTLITDTTMRDAHQSLLTTRVRTYDMKKIAPYTAHDLSDAFSLEMWGGATFDVAYNFLKEDPWRRLEILRKEIPNVLFQMLLRASNAVGYKNYPDNVVEKFVQESADAGIDVFRIFDSLNWMEAMKQPIEAVLKTGKVAEGAICYTGDILNPERSNVYTLDYYRNMAKALEAEGVHILAIKDMAGLLKPQAAYELIGELKATVDIPIHLHTHDTSGNGVLMYHKAIEAGVDVVDTALGAMSGLTSQPSANSLYYAQSSQDRQIRADIDGLERLSQYWESVRRYYTDFESDIKSPNTEIYKHEMPGGQYSNLFSQAKSLGLGERYGEVKKMYQKVNMLFGDIVKVTPSSKVVGDMALFMVQNDLDEESVIERGPHLDFPDSVVSFFKGEIGRPVSGFNTELQDAVLKGAEPLTERPGKVMEPVDFDALREEVSQFCERKVTDKDVLSYALYPKVFKEFISTNDRFGNVEVLDTPTFLFGMRKNEVLEIEIDKGKTLIVNLLSVGHVHEDGCRWMYFELNGFPRKVYINDENVESTSARLKKADPTELGDIGAQMPGTVSTVKYKAGDTFKKGEVIIITEAMKMENSVKAPFDGKVAEVFVSAGDKVASMDLMMTVEKA